MSAEARFERDRDVWCLPCGDYEWFVVPKPPEFAGTGFMGMSGGLSPAWPTADCADDIVILSAEGVSPAELRRVQRKLDDERAGCWFVKYLKLVWVNL